MTDWMATLREQRALAEKMSDDIPRMLADPELTFDLAMKLYRALENQAEFMKLLARKLEQGGFDFDIVSVAERLEERFADLAVVAAEKTRELSGRR
jgi:hypothetical protein